MATRRTDICQGCQEEGEIAAHGLCFKCYRRCERQALCQKEGWNPGDTRKQKRLARAHAKLVEGLLEFGAGTFANAVRLLNTLGEELLPLPEYMVNVNVNSEPSSRSQGGPEKEEGHEEEVKVNSELRSRSQEGPPDAAVHLGTEVNVNSERSSRSQEKPGSDECEHETLDAAHGQGSAPAAKGREGTPTEKSVRFRLRKAKAQRKWREKQKLARLADRAA